MNKKSKKTLFLACLIFFLIAAPAILFYCLGYRIDFLGKSIVKTGALYLKIIPKQAQIFLDDKIKEKTDLFFGIALIENLLPQDYRLKIEKQGYQAWKKTLTVKEGRATEAKNIALVPEKLDLEILNENVVDFWFSPNNQKIILKEKIFDEQHIEKGWNLKLLDAENKIKIPIFAVNERKEENNSSPLPEQTKKETSAAHFEQEGILLNLKWSENSKKILLKTKLDGKEQYFLFGLETIPAKIEMLEFLEGGNFIPFFHPDNDQKLILEQKNEQGLITLWESDFKGELSQKIIDGAIGFAASNKNIIWLDQNGSLQRSNTQGQTQTMSLTPLDTEGTNDYEIIMLDADIFVLKNKTLWFFDSANRIFKNIGDNVNGFVLSPNKKKLCFWNDFQAEIFFFEEETSQPLRKKESKILLIRLSQKIQDFFWWNDHYLIFKTQETIKVIEIDDRDNAQTWDLVRLKEPKAYFNPKNRKLYLLSQDDFFSSSSF